MINEKIKSFQIFSKFPAFFEVGKFVVGYFGRKRSNVFKLKISDQKLSDLEKIKKILRKF